MTGQLSDKKELTWQEWEKMENDNTVLVDLREEVVYHHGSIPGAVCIPLRCFAEEKEKLPKDKCIVVFCQRGEKRDRPQTGQHYRIFRAGGIHRQSDPDLFLRNVYAFGVFSCGSCRTPDSFD